MKRTLMAAALVCGMVGNAYAADAKAMVPLDTQKGAGKNNNGYLCASGLKTDDEVSHDIACKFMLSIMSTEINGQMAREQAADRIKSWDPRGSTPLCPKPHRMTDDGCQ